MLVAMARWAAAVLTVACLWRAVAVGADSKAQFVTCGSVVKLQHGATGFFLHSHEIPYGSGSGQQSVTAFPGFQDANSYWRVWSKTCDAGKQIADGDVISLEHAATKRMLHSHLHQSPLSSQQEVSCYEGRDTGDFWKLKTTGGAKVWKKGAPVQLEHTDTGLYLSSNARHRYGDPIRGQQEVACSREKGGKNAEWSAQLGIYLPASES